MLQSFLAFLCGDSQFMAAITTKKMMMIWLSDIDDVASFVLLLCDTVVLNNIEVIYG
ncbi:MAG: hypothetical protein ACRC6S_05480 [Shewanella sp.]